MTPGEHIQRLLADVHRYEPHDIIMLLPYVAALQSALHTRMLALQDHADLPDTDRLLNSEETAKRLGTSVKWVRENPELLPFGFQMGKLRRFSARGLDVWIDAQQAATMDAALPPKRRQHER